MVGGWGKGGDWRVHAAGGVKDLGTFWSDPPPATTGSLFVSSSRLSADASEEFAGDYLARCLHSVRLGLR